MFCPVCGTSFDERSCPMCGYEKSIDFTRRRTLSRPSETDRLVFSYHLAGTKRLTEYAAAHRERVSRSGWDVAKLDISEPPARTRYSIGDVFDPAGMELTVTFANGLHESVRSGFTCDPTPFGKSGRQSVEVSCRGVSLSVPVLVSAPVHTYRNLTWSFQDGTLEIMGAGSMPDFNPPDVPPWSEYLPHIWRIVLSPQLTSIGNRAFSNCEELTSVSIPKGIKRIGRRAFYFCSALNVVRVPASVTVIEEYAFSSCSELGTIELSEGLIGIGDCAFSYFYKMDDNISIRIPATVRYVGRRAFDGWGRRHSIIVGDLKTQSAAWDPRWSEGCQAVIRS